MREMLLSNGGRTVVDDDVFDCFGHYKWRLDNRGYAIRSTQKNGRPVVVRLHQEILKDVPMIDHANGDKLDNRRANLRVCTPAQNSQNRRAFGGKSRYKGVTWHGHARRWQAQLKTDGRGHYLGLFESEEDAARAYDQAAIKHYGAFAYLNFSVA